MQITRRVSVLFASIGTLFLLVSVVRGTPPTSPYNPGETLTPTCVPGSANCSVRALAVSGANSDITSLTGLTTPLSFVQGGTGLATLASGKLLYASALDVLSALTLGSSLTITGGTVDVTGLKSATTNVDVSAATAPSAGQILMATSGTAATWQTPSGLTGFTAASTVATPNATTSVSSLTAIGAGSVPANADVVLAPLGTGSLLADVPDNLAAGGAKRGTYATDWQRERTGASQVASGINSVIGGGYANTAGSAYSTIGGGYTNVASDSYTTVVGGRGNTASGYAATVTGGFSNTAMGQYSTVGGFSNTASGQYSTMSGGVSGTASGQYSVVVGGNANTASAQYSTIGGGALNTASGINSVVPGGYYGTTRGIDGRFSFASKSAALGTAQMGIHVTRRQTTDGTVSSLSTDGSAPAATSTNVLPNSHAYKVRVEVVARVAGAGITDTKAWTIEVLVRRGASAAETAIIGSPTITVIGADAGAAAWAATVIANTTLGSIDVSVTGEAAKTISWVATMYTTEVGG